MTICQVLTELGVHAKPPRGKPPTYTPEEAYRVRHQQCKKAQIAMREEDMACKTAGLEPPTRKRGRPRIYATPAEAKAAGRAQNKVCRVRLKERLEDAILALKPMLDSAREAARSNAQQNNLAVV